MTVLSNPLIGGGLFLGAITTGLYCLKGFGEKILNKLKEKFIFKVIVYDYDELFYVIENYISKNYPQKYKNLEASYEKTRTWVKGLSEEPLETTNKKYRKVYWKQEPNIFTIKVGGKILFFTKEKKELEHAQELKNALSFHYSISAWKGKKVILRFIEEITEDYNKSLITGKINLYTPSYDRWNIVGSKKVKTIDKVVLQKHTKDFIINDLDSFVKNRNWYEEVNISYKRSYLLYGPPGTGKTTTAQSIAGYLQKDICCLNLSSIINDATLISIFSSIPENSLLLIEDIDCIFIQREAVSADIKITFSCLLNCLDGVISKDGLITIITTNHIEKLDTALIRPGRIDKQIEMPLASNVEIEEYLNIFYNKQYSLGGNNINISMSTVQEACIKNRDNPEKAICEIINS